jgi:probable O-glycosylation ligase (exosortase A-associated)
MFMLVPILGALALTASARWQRYGLRFLTVGVIYRAIVTYSRGGFLTGLAVLIVYFIRSQNKIRTLIVVGVLSALIVPVLPQTFWNRMSTITAPAEQRAEVSEGRTFFWRVAIQMAATNPLVGIGHNAFIPAFDRYDTSFGAFGTGRAVHSAWFGPLAELGYPGFALFVANIVLCFLACRRVRRLSRSKPEAAALGVYATALETAMVAFAVGGSFVSFQYNEMLWHTVGLSAALNAIAIRMTSIAVIANPKAAAIATPVEHVRFRLSPR